MICDIFTDYRVSREGVIINETIFKKRKRRRKTEKQKVAVKMGMQSFWHLVDQFRYRVEWIRMKKKQVVYRN